jgi:ribosome-binding protein aMBF1 (putative translation factor)
MFLDRRLCPAARAWIGWSQQDLADHSHVSLSTVRALESGEAIHRNHEEAMQRALTDEGIAFSVDAQGNLSLSYNSDDEFVYEIVRRKRKSS